MQDQLKSEDVQFGIIGLGLIGGSIAKSLSANKFEVFAEDLNQSYFDAAIKDSVIVGSLDEINTSKDLILIICVPVSAHESVFLKHLNLLNEAKLVTDCSSVKNSVLNDLNKNGLKRDNYVFSHPMAGSEKSGYLNSNEKLFEDKTCILMTGEETQESSLRLCESLWQILGSKISLLDLKDHDSLLALTSHLPHLISFSLISTLAELKLESNKIFSGGGLKDFTRIASSDVKMWKDIFSNNSGNISDAIDKFIEKITLFKNYIVEKDSESIENFIENAKNFRDENL
ncbi:MAG: prephenate dehydrogenase [Gammaproteobacteria bacterium]